jgi:hypothetical protein
MRNAALESRFDWVRMQAARAMLVVVPRKGDCLLLPAMAASSVKPEMAAAVEGVIPSAVPQNVAVIGNTTWNPKVPPSVQGLNQAIPFFGMLMSFTFLGHAVWIFDGSGGQFTLGCRDADILMVDSAQIPSLARSWVADARNVMRGTRILVHDRATYRLMEAR